MSVGPSLLFIIGEPQSEQHLSLIHDRIKEGLTTWTNNTSCPEDLNTELLNFINSDLAPEQTDGNGLVIKYDGKMYVEVLLEPTINLFNQALHNFLLMPSTFKLIVHAGPAYQGNGSWILKDGTFSMHDLVRLLHRGELANILYNNAANQCHTTISCIGEGEWSDAGLKLHDAGKRYSMNIMQAGPITQSPACSNDLAAYICRMLKFQSIESSMPLSQMVGSIKFRRPTMYLFPAGQGEACLLGVNGFTLLLDGGFQRRTCFWDFLCHVDRLDAVVITSARPGASNGASALLKRLSAAQPNGHPAVTYCFANVPVRPSGTVGQAKHALLVSPFASAYNFIDDAKRLSLNAHALTTNAMNATTKKPEPFTLYQKVGLGRLDMYVLNPSKDGKEFQDFTTNFKKLMTHLSAGFVLKPGSNGVYSAPLIDQCSASILLIWQPANDQEQIVRVLFSGSVPQERIFQGMEKLKHLECLRYKQCTQAFLNQPPSKRAAPNILASSKPSRKSLDLPSLRSKVAATTVLSKLENGSLKDSISPATVTSQVVTPFAAKSPTTSGGGIAASPKPDQLNGAGDLVQLVEEPEHSSNIVRKAPPQNLEIGNDAQNGKDNVDDVVQVDGPQTPGTVKLIASLNPEAAEFVPRRVSLESPSQAPICGINIIPPSPRPQSSTDNESKHENKNDFENEVPPHQPQLPTPPTSLEPFKLVENGQMKSNERDLLVNSMDDDLKNAVPNTPPSQLLHQYESVHTGAATKTVQDLEHEWGPPLGLPPVQENGGEEKPKSAATSKKPLTPAQDSAKKGATASTLKAKLVPKNAEPSKSASAKTTKPDSTLSKSDPACSKPIGARKSLLATAAKHSAPEKPAIATKPVKPAAPVSAASTTNAVKPAATSVVAKKTPTIASNGGGIYHVDLAYLPHNGNPFYFSADFVRNIRAKYYVLSAAQPSTESLEALLAGKRAWATPDDETTLIPTNDSEQLGLWLAQRRGELAAENLNVAPSCARCTLNLEEPQEAVCAAYRLEL